MTEQAAKKKVLSKSRSLIPLLVVLALLALGLWLFQRYYGNGSHLPPGEENMPAIKVIVSNGCGYEQLASQYAQYVSSMNIEVVKLTDMPKPIYDKSVIVMRKDDEEDLRRLQAMTGIMRFTKALNESSEAPFMIILGRDYQEFMKKKQGGTFGR